MAVEFYSSEFIRNFEYCSVMFYHHFQHWFLKWFFHLLPARSHNLLNINICRKRPAHTSILSQAFLSQIFSWLQTAHCTLSFHNKKKMKKNKKERMNWYWMEPMETRFVIYPNNEKHLKLYWYVSMLIDSLRFKMCLEWPQVRREFAFLLNFFIIFLNLEGNAFFFFLFAICNFKKEIFNFLSFKMRQWNDKLFHLYHTRFYLQTQAQEHHSLTISSIRKCVHKIWFRQIQIPELNKTQNKKQQPQNHENIV